MFVMLGKIYLRLYFWFLLVFILTILLVSTLVHGFYIERVRDALEGQFESQAKFLLTDYQNACGDPAKRESKACREFLERIRRIRPLHFWILDRSGKVLLSNDRYGALPIAPGDLARAATGERVMSRRRRAPGYAIVPLQSDSGSVEQFAVVQRGFPGERFPRFPLVASSIIAMITIAVLILPLSKRLTKPVRELHQLGREWAEGHLEKRASVSGKDEISELAQTFNNMAEKLQKMLQQRKEFLASISHELKSPLTRMRIALELLSEKTGQADSEKLIQSIQNEIAESEKLIEQLLILSRIEMNIPVPHEPLQLEDVVGRAFAQTKALADHQDVLFKLTGTAAARGDSIQLEKALVNILENAIKFSQAGQLIEVELSRREGNAVLACKDQGPGVQPGEGERLFDAFYRGTASSGKSGSGLGLFIAKRIVEMHSGTIHAEQNQPQGTVIIITLPGNAGATN